MFQVNSGGKGTGSGETANMGMHEPMMVEQALLARAASYRYQISSYELNSEGLWTLLPGVSFLRSNKHLTGWFTC
jgi:hypothetical protein